MISLIRTMNYLLLFCAAALFAENFTAHVDKTTLPAGRSLVLTLEFDGQSDEQPDLSPIETDFSILSRETRHESTFINGNRQKKTSWVFEIVPRSSSKNLTIPSIKYGKFRSNPISIVQAEVTEKNDDIVVSMTADKSDVYVNGELIITLTIKSALALRNASLSKPDVKDAIVEPLIEGERSEIVEQGIKYSIFKQSYAVYPNKPGTLSISPVLFRGIAGFNSRGSQGFGGLFSSASSVSARSNELSVKVKDVPASFPKDEQFLPLKSLVVIESFDEPNPSFAINEATARRFEIKAKGALATFLPNVSTPSVKDLQIYAETGNKVQKNEQDGIISSVKFSHVYMPLAAGQVRVPEQTIYWWDVDRDELKTASIRAFDFTVTGDVQKEEPKEDAPNSIASFPTDNPQNGEKAAEPESLKENYWWQIIALSSVALWLITMGLFLWQRRKKQSVKPLSHKKSITVLLNEKVNETLTLCKTADAKKVYAALQSLILFIEQQKIVITEARQLIELNENLERALYQREANNTNEIIQQVKNRVAKITIEKPPKMVIAPLYPS